MLRLPSERLDYPGDGLHYFEGQPFTGVMEFRRPDGGLEGEEEYRDGLLWGCRRIWFPSGRPQEEAECAWGGYHGRAREWYEDGRLASDEVYEYGIRTRGTTWGEDGQVAEEFKLSESDPAYRTLELFRAAFGDAGKTAESAVPPGQPRDDGMTDVTPPPA
jgi:antitoxin component YwqK of YwqJK toxin-antitoxin module